MQENQNENIVIVIDPGHGGENLGAEYDTFLEKEMNMVVADAMATELKKYEGITVYLTHNDDVDMSLKERADFAKSVNADFLFCLHFNMSVKHDLFGSEVWISAFGTPYLEGASFGEIQINSMKELGLYSRGVKTKLNDEGTDYYGIIRHCTEYNIPSALIEHCHVDNVNDSIFCDNLEELIAFGKADATNVAKYFGLKSEILGVDYENFESPVYTVLSDDYIAKPDTTPPDISFIEKIQTDYENGNITIQISGNDADSSLLYFTYSLDGGNTYSELKEWPENTDSFHFNLTINNNTTPIIVIRIYNKYDLYTESNVLYYGTFSFQNEETKKDLDQTSNLQSEETINTSIGVADNPWLPHQNIINNSSSHNSIIIFLYLSLSIATIVFLSAVILKIIAVRKKKKKHNKLK